MNLTPTRIPLCFKLVYRLGGLFTYSPPPSEELHIALNLEMAELEKARRSLQKAQDRSRIKQNFDSSTQRAVQHELVRLIAPKIGGLPSVVQNACSINPTGVLLLLLCNWSGAVLSYSQSLQEHPPGAGAVTTSCHTN